MIHEANTKDKVDGGGDIASGIGDNRKLNVGRPGIGLSSDDRSHTVKSALVMDLHRSAEKQSKIDPRAKAEMIGQGTMGTRLPNAVSKKRFPTFHPHTW
jgi:hypothetical protein